MAIVNTFSKKAAAAALVALTLGAGLTMNPGEAEARYGRKGLIAAGVIGALTVGAIAASSHNAYAGNGYATPGYYADPDLEYAQPAPVYYRESRHVYQQAPVYEYIQPRGHYEHHRPYRHRYSGYSETGMAYKGPVCKLKRQTYFDGYGYRTQKVQVCR